MDPFLAKDMIKVLNDNIEKYEKKFGKIKRPSALEKTPKQVKKGKVIKQDYFG